MYHFTRIKRLLKKKLIKITAPIRRKKLKSTDFTIISNNCWAGDVYRYLGLPYQTPTVGMYFFSKEYIRLLSNIEYYFSLPLQQMEFKDSRYQDELSRKGQQNVPLAKLGDVEIVLLHYKNWEEAKEKWDRRVKRINPKALIVKFSRQNLCTDEDVNDFLRLPFKKKIFFNNLPTEAPDTVYLPGSENEEYLKDDLSSYRKYMDIIAFINEKA